MKKRVCILYTGGTIGMVATERGFAPEKGSFKAAMEKIDDLNAPEMPEWELIEFDPLLDSSNIAVEQWNQIGQTIAGLYDRFDGFVILHGTDTMAYTASALAFMLENLDKPVILTGSQIPLCCLRSDARDNLVTSLMIAAEGVVREVCLYFGGRLLRGCRSMKISADGLIAFGSPGERCLAEAGISITYHRDSLRAPAQKNAFRFIRFRQSMIGVLKVFPGIQFELFESIMTEKLKGIVLETFGAGNIPNSANALLPILRRAFAHGTVVVVCSQCPQGTVHLGTYETSAALKQAGALSGWNMTTEAAVAKLYYLLSLDLSEEEIKRQMEENLRGELTRGLPADL